VKGGAAIRAGGREPSARTTRGASIHRHFKENPPSTTRCWPVMKFASAEAKNKMT
jgi:hypothetical protein